MSGRMTAEDVKRALRGRHQGQTMNSMVAAWTCIEEWMGVDLLALNAWRAADVIGYEVKVSRSDMRRELLRPDKRAAAIEHTTEFYFAVPAGLLTADEICFEEPEWEDGDFDRMACPGIPEFGGPRWRHRPDAEQRFGGECGGRYSAGKTRGPFTVRAPRPRVLALPDWMQPRPDESDESFEARRLTAAWQDFESIEEWEGPVPCPTCGGKGYVDVSRVERDAPTCWVPRDVGLVTVDGRGCRVVKRSPKRKTCAPLASSRQGLNDLIRWVSHRPDPRHATPAHHLRESEAA